MVNASIFKIMGKCCALISLKSYLLTGEHKNTFLTFLLLWEYILNPKISKHMPGRQKKDYYNIPFLNLLYDIQNYIFSFNTNWCTK